jgi:UDP-2,3-diacylglucosamine hydrolase
MISRFLPSGFEPSRRIAILAGKGRYPELLAQSIRHHNIPLCLVGFQDETEPHFTHSFPASERREIKVGQVGKLLKSLEQLGAQHAIMAGQITPGRLFKGLHPDLRALTILATLKERNAETIFGAIAREVESLGISLLDARSFLDSFLATEGMMTRSRKPLSPDHLEHGIRIAKEIARLDIGQGVVVRKGTVLVVEGFDGTNAMLRRAGTFDASEKIFVKTVKPRQDYRFDVPVFGARTLDVLQEAKIGAVALEAGKTIILDKPAVLQQADRAGIRIYGYTESDYRPA